MNPDKAGWVAQQADANKEGNKHNGGRAAVLGERHGRLVVELDRYEYGLLVKGTYEEER